MKFWVVFDVPNYVMIGFMQSDQLSNPAQRSNTILIQLYQTLIVWYVVKNIQM